MAELSRVIEQISKDKGIEKKVIVEALESALLIAAKKRLGEERDFEVHYNEETDELELFEFKTVAEKVTNPIKEIEMKEAKKLDPEANIGDSLGLKLDAKEFGRILSQAAKHIIIQKVQEAEKDIIYNEFVNRKGELVTGIVRRYDKKDIIVDLGKTEACLPFDEQIFKERYRQNDRIQTYILDVRKNPFDHQIILSRARKEFLIKLFHMEVPEIEEGIVKIKDVARDPGERAKISVYSVDSNVDPIGACVGLKGSRIQNVVQELRGEKIDIILYDSDITKYICNAISPAQVTKVIADDSKRLIELIIPDDQSSLAIGKKGQNVKLASQLLNWKIDVISESQAKELAKHIKNKFLTVEGIDDSIADLLVKKGFSKFSEFQNLPAENISTILGISIQKSNELLENIKKTINNEEIKKNNNNINIVEEQKQT
jgi:N utilization substance protein A